MFNVVHWLKVIEQPIAYLQLIKASIHFQSAGGFFSSTETSHPKICGYTCHNTYIYIYIYIYVVCVNIDIPRITKYLKDLGGVTIVKG